jgi:hypothetical protein
MCEVAVSAYGDSCSPGNEDHKNCQHRYDILFATPYVSFEERQEIYSQTLEVRKTVFDRKFKKLTA